MKVIKIKRLWNGFASIRSYAFQDAIKNNETIKIACNKEVMTLTPNDLISKSIQTKKTIFTSKINGDTYTLVDFKFVPDNTELPIIL